MNATNGLMSGKRGLIMGLANNRSLAWGIAQALHDQGAKLAFTYTGVAIEKRMRPLAESVGSDIILECDVTDMDDLDRTFAEIERKWGKLDFVVHAIAYSDKEELKGRYVDTSPENFATTMNISCYSLTAVALRAEKLMSDGGAILTLSYYGSQRTVPQYNVMGVAKAALEASVRYLAKDLGPKNIRVNAISAGPIKTLASSGVGNFRYLLKWNETNAPLQRNVTIEDVGGSALYLLSDLSAAVTGVVHNVDSGYHVIGIVDDVADDTNES